jgi:hypothetical protein
MLERRNLPASLFFFESIFFALISGCATPATFEGMVSTSFETTRRHPYAIRVNVTGGQDSESPGRPQITGASFAQALTESIRKSGAFSRVVDEQNAEENFILAVTLFSIDKRLFGRTVKLEAGWTLRRAGTKAVVWQESITSEFTDSNLQVATEGAARNNIVQGLTKISKLNLSSY